MRAIIQETYGPVDALHLAERERPTPADDAVLIRVRAAGIDPGVWHMMTGRPYLARLMGIGFSKPKVPVAGWDAAGVVEAVGAKVSRFKAGDEVFGNCGSEGSGTFADYACLPENRCAHKPSNLSFEEASALAVSGCTALESVRDVGKVGPGTRVLVLGAGGGVGHLAVQIAKALGAHVTGASGPAKLDFVRSLGADEALDYAGDGFGDRQWDVIVDTGGRRPLGALRRLLTPKGTLAIVGGEGGNAWTGGFFERIIGAAAISAFASQKLVGVNVAVRRQDLETLRELAEAGKVRPVIDQRYALENAVAALKHLEQGHARGKSVVVMA